jgi:hypothetical protein
MATLRTVLEPQDEYPHQPDEAENYNESMYLNAFDATREVGGWFRLGNRVNEVNEILDQAETQGRPRCVSPRRFLGDDARP